MVAKPREPTLWESVAIPQLNKQMSIGIDSTCSVFTAECIALLEAMKIVMEYSNYRFLIISNSLSALKSLSNPKINISTNKYLVDIKAMYNKWLKNNSTYQSINFIWVPAHKGIIDNKKADQLAKQAMISVNDTDYRIPFTDYREFIKGKI